MPCYVDAHLGEVQEFCVLSKEYGNIPDDCVCAEDLVKNGKTKCDCEFWRNGFTFAEVLPVLAEGKKARRSSWEEGEYFSAEEKFGDPKSYIALVASDILAADWEIENVPQHFYL